MKKLIKTAALCIITLFASAQQNSPNPKWMTPDGQVNAMVKDGNTVYLGGAFNGVGYARPGIAKFSPLSDDAPQINNTAISGTILKIISDNAGGWYIGGNFSYNINGNGFRGVAHLKADLSLDTSFTFNFYGPYQNQIVALCLNGTTLYIGGNIYEVNGVGRDHIAAVNATTGNLLPWQPLLFSPGTAIVSSIAVKDSLVLVTGSFSSIESKKTNGFAVLSANTGMLKSNFEGIDGTSSDLLINDNKAYIAGSFNKTGTRVGGVAQFIGSTQNRNISFPQTNGKIYDAIQDGSGGWYIGGTFSNIMNTGINFCAHVFSNGVVDTNFRPQPNQFVRALHLKNGLLYLGGSFDNMNVNQPVTLTRNRLAAVDPLTGLATGWDPNADGWVNSITSKDSLIFIGGNFNNVQNIGTGPLVCVSAATGLLKSSFKLSIQSYSNVSSLKVDGNKLYVGGGFTGVGKRALGLAKTTTTSDIIDANYPETDGTTYAIEADGSGGYYIGGSFNTVGGISLQNIAHILANGTVDPAFIVLLDGDVRAITVAASAIYIGGNFGNVNNQFTGNFAKVNLSGNLVTPFAAKVYGSVSTICLKGTTLYLGGSFYQVDTNGTTVTRNNACALNSTNGKLLSWNPGPDNIVNKIIANAAGNKIYLAGDFGNINGISRSKVACVNANTGTVLSLNPSISHYVRDMFLDGSQLFLAGGFDDVNSVVRYGIASIDTINGLTTSLFTAGEDVHTNIYCMHKNGATIYIGGEFPHLFGTEGKYLAALNSTTGALLNWYPKPNGYVYAIKSIGTNVVFGGNFSQANTTACSNVARINLTTVTLDNNWLPAIDGAVRVIEKIGNKVWLGGDFNNVNGNARVGLCAIDSVSGTLLSFDAGLNGAVYSLKNVGNIVFAQGYFTTVDNGNTSRNYAAAFNSTSGLVTSWNPNPNNLDLGNWYGNEKSCIAYDGTNLLMGGPFDLLDCKNHNNLAEIDLVACNFTSFQLDCDNNVNSLNSFGNKIFVTGNGLLTVNGQTRNGAFAFEKGTTNLFAFNPDANIVKQWDPFINDLIQIKDKVYLSGSFNDSISKNLVSVDTLGNLITNWAPKPNGDNVFALAGDTTQLIVGGGFSFLNYTNNSNILALNATTGKVIKNFVANINPNSYGVVMGLSILGNNVYACGYFGEANGITRGSLAAFNKTTGVLQNFAPIVEGGIVNKIENDGTYIYIVGEFNMVNSTSRGRGASFTVAGVLRAWDPQADNTIRDLWIKDTVIYLGGNFSQLKGVARQYCGAVSKTNSLKTFDPQPDGEIRAITGNLKHLYLGGDYSNIAGQTRKSLTSFNLSNHSLRAWDNNLGNWSNVNTLELATGNLYVGGKLNYSNGMADIVAVVDTATGISTGFHPIQNNDNWGIETKAILPVCNDLLVTFFNTVGGPSYLAGFDNSISISSSITKPTCTYNTNGAINLNLSNGYLPYVNYAWSTGASTQNISNLSAGSYTTTITDGLGCSTTKSINVVSQFANPVAIITGPSAICSGQSGTLTVTSNNAYLWSTGATTQSIVVNSAGAYTVTVTGAGGCTIVSAAKVVSVAPSPNIVVTPNPASLCKGDSVLLNASGASTYLWSPSTGLSATNLASVYSKATATLTYTVNGTNGNGCSGTASVSLTVKTKPTVTVTPATATICPGNTAVITAAGTATAFAWSPGTGLNQTTGTPVTASPLITTTYMVTGSSANGCTATKTAKVTLSTPKPINLNSSAITASGATLKWDTVACAIGYKLQYRKQGVTAWTTVNITTNTPSKTLAGLLATTVYQYRVAAKYPSATYSGFSVIASFTTLIIREGEQIDAITNALLVYPNPAIDKLNIEFPFTQSNATIQVVNALGQVVLEQKANVDDEFITLDIQNLMPGLFLVNVINGDTKFTSRFMKK